MAFGIGIILVNAVLFIPGLQTLFQVAPLTIDNVIKVHILAFIPTVIIQCVKVIRDVIENRNKIVIKDSKCLNVR